MVTDAVSQTKAARRSGRYWTWDRWRKPILLGLAVAYIGWNLAAIAGGLVWLTPGNEALGIDFRQYAVDPAQPYASGGFRYPPLTAWALAPFVPLGFGMFVLLHVAAVAVIPDRTVALLLAVSWPFYVDIVLGNTFTFAFAAACLAMAGSRWGTWAFLFATALIPRPFMLPIAVWLVWRRPETRPAALIVAAIAVSLNLATGQVDEYLAMLRVWSPIEFARHEFVPERVLGWLAVPLSVVLAGIAVWKNRPGLAALIIQPYIGPKHLMFGLLELGPARWREPSARAVVDQTREG